MTRIEQRLWKRLESAFVCGKCPLQTWFALDDNAQSVAANIKVTPAKAKCQRVVLDVLRQYGPLTCKEIACQLDVEMQHDQRAHYRAQGDGPGTRHRQDS